MKRSSIRSLALWLGAGLLLLLLLLLLLRPAGIAVDTAMVRRGPVRAIVEQEGRTRLIKRFVVSAPIAGRLRRLVPREGDRLERGEVIGSLLPPRLDPSALRQATLAAESSKAAWLQAEERRKSLALAAAEATLRAERHEALHDAGAVSQEAFEQAATDAAQLAREVASARSAAEAARLAWLSRESVVAGQREAMAAPLISPVEGVVLRVLEASEREVEAGRALLEVGDPSRLEVVIELLSLDATRVRSGMRVELSGWGGGDTLQAVVDRVEPSAFTKRSALGVDEQRVTVVARLLEACSTLGDGYRVEATVVLAEVDSVLKVPSGALFRRGGRWQLFKVERGRARLITVELGLQGAMEHEVRSGLAEGELVVLYPPRELDDGARVEVREGER